ncbi:septum site-determining protein MinC [Marinilactibacillus psychrotolerans]|uniref:Probable septum site-determining protein MinC n=1 Tax=Marinilactibacillus psychrotolerans TaxID=191770 RepID=A0A5R9C1W0_9LACT|nr:septum site-determining protein MinC [Marinilactibacillus psychrotolerans]TLQ06651.1 septum site-determining protein MinC [Marinilactibacillus psychrotolerans]
MQKVVTLKGTKDGFQLLVDQAAAFQTVLDEMSKLIEPLKKEAAADKPLELTIKTGNKLFTDREKSETIALIEDKSNLKVKNIESEVVTIDRALKWHNEVSTKLQVSTVRSGQMIKVEGDLVLVGSVHPGGTVKATGSIFILGDLRGTAHAGSEGKEESVVVANFSYNAQVRIVDHVHVIEQADIVASGSASKVEVVYLDDLHILRVSPLSDIKNLRPELGYVTGGLING